VIRAVFFDYDGVLTTDRTGTLTTCRFLAGATHIPVEAWQRALRPFNRDLSTGLLTYRTIWSRVCADLGAQMPPSLLDEAFASTPVNQPMLDLARELGTTCRVGIITDNKRERMAVVREHQRLDQWFDPIVVSAEVGSTKDGEAIYANALARVNLAASACVFVDNSESNVEVARRLGFHAIRFDDARNDVNGLRRSLALDHGLPGLVGR